MPISFTQAALGGEIDIPTADGSAKIKVPPETQTHQVVSAWRGRAFKGRSLELRGRPAVRGRGRDAPCGLTDRQKEPAFAELEEINTRTPNRPQPTRPRVGMSISRRAGGPA